MTEQERVHQIMQDMHCGKATGERLYIDPVTKTVRPTSSCATPENGLVITPSDMEHFAARTGV